MTDEQRLKLSAQINAMQGLLIVIAKAMPKHDEIKQRFEQEGLAIACLLGTNSPEAYLDKIRAECDRLSRLL